MLLLGRILSFISALDDVGMVVLELDRGCV